MERSLETLIFILKETEMIVIQADEKGRALVLGVGDRALKYSGNEALFAVNELYRAIRPLPPEPEQESPDKGDTHGTDTE